MKLNARIDWLEPLCALGVVIVQNAYLLGFRPAPETIAIFIYIQKFAACADKNNTICLKKI